MGWPVGLALTAAVSVAHLWLADVALPSRLGAGAPDAPARIEVAFVQELAPAAPPAAAPAPRALLPARATAVAAPLPAASAPMPDGAASAPDPADVQASTAVASAPPASSAHPAAVAAADAALSAGSAPASALGATTAAAALAGASAAAAGFEWPPSTRLSYRLSGNFRGPVEGQAQVEWLRSGKRYQVHMDVSVGPAMAPLMSRRVTSEGEITADGLRPESFDEETRVLWRPPRRLRIEMGPEIVRLAQGQPWARPAGLQDTASQFVQLTWLFTMQPALLQAGQTVPLPLALPRRIQLWQYQVGASETLETPAGAIDAVHVRPRPDAEGEARRGGDLVPEAWFAPTLQYLPVRILIRQDGDNYVDLRLERLPQQALQAQPGR